MNETVADTAPEATAYYLSRADGMSDEYVSYAKKLAIMAYQTLSGPQLYAIEAPAIKPWADTENRAYTEEIAGYVDAAAEIAELILPDLGVDPEPLRLEAETGLQAGHKLEICTVPLESWNDAVMFRFVYGHVLAGQMAGVIGSNYIRYANVAQKLYFRFCEIDWPAEIGSPQIDRVKRTIEEAGKDVVQAALNKWWAPALRSFGESGSANEQAYLRLGLKTRPNDMCCEMYLDLIRRDLSALGLDDPTS